MTEISGRLTYTFATLEEFNAALETVSAAATMNAVSSDQPTRVIVVDIDTTLGN